MLTRGERVQLSITEKGGKMRQVLLAEIVSRSLLSLRGDAGVNDPVFASRKAIAHGTCRQWQGKAGGDQDWDQQVSVTSLAAARPWLADH